jgi:hypothetical protein
MKLKSTGISKNPMIPPMSTTTTHWVNLARESTMAHLSTSYLRPTPYAAADTAAVSARPHTAEAPRALAGMLLAASLAALLVVADQVIDTWTDGHLLAGWVALWTVAFAALAFLAPPLRKVAAYAAGGFLRHLAAMRLERDEARMWEMARHDPRVMEEIRAAMSRHEAPV